ncbi:MAG: A24 family peptidase [Candidatus Woesearchaeota archaeon]
MQYLFFLLAFIGLVVGSYTDFKTREVPDWISYGLIFLGIFINIIYSIIIGSVMPTIHSFFGLAIATSIALIMFYLGEWGGGDSKMIMAIGAIIGMGFSLDSFFLNFLINTFFIGAFYGFFYGLILAFKNLKRFKKEFKGLYHKKKYSFVRKIMLAVSGLLIFLSLFFSRYIMIHFLILSLICIIAYFLIIFAKTIEKCCMLKEVSPAKLTEGDWIAKDVFVKGKRICGPKDLGISAEQIEMLKKSKIKKVLMKEGIPFIPSFLISFCVSYFFGNIIFLLF